VLSDLSSSDLLELCLDGTEESAWNEFIRRYHSVIAANVIRVARQYKFDSMASVEDLIQEVYLRLCDRDCKILREFRCERPEALYSFLKVVTANLARDRCQAMLSARRGSGKVVPLSAGGSALPEPAAFTNRIEYEIFLRTVKDALSSVAAERSTARDRSIFWLYYRQGLTATEIAAIPAFGLTAKGVESLLKRLVRDVRSALLPEARLKKESRGQNRSTKGDSS
jgi:RNA polymerase sigma-70 factor, ECF subfamily